jgi:exopolysaccharide biosynthesis polyprenyl glycosylphosphotransferase
MVFDLGMMALSFVVASVLASRPTTLGSLANFLSIRVKVQNIIIFLVLLFGWHVIFSAFGLYQSRRLNTRTKEGRDVLKGTLTGMLLLGLASVVFSIRMVTPVFLVAFWVVSSSMVLSGRLVLRYFLGWVRARGRNLRQILIVGTNPRAVRFAQAIESRLEFGYRLIGFVDEEWDGIGDFRKTGHSVVTNFQDFQCFLREHVVEEVALALPMKSCYPRASLIVAQCEEQGITVRFLPNIFDVRLVRSNQDDFDQDAVITLDSNPLEGWPVAIKRVLDVVISLAILILAAPLMLIAAMLIKYDSPGPILFSQERVGLNKRRFHMYKLRTMISNAEKRQAELERRNEADGPVFKIKDDPRVTLVGKLLRKTSIDELPQLFNVLKGEMSLVGPRPLPLRDFAGFSQDWHRRRFSVRPGITCLWQINGRSSVPFDRWMDLDMHYIDHWSLWLDLKILAKTIPAVLRGAGAT